MSDATTNPADAGDRATLERAMELVAHLPGSNAAADVEALARVVLDLKGQVERLSRLLGQGEAGGDDDEDDPAALAEAIRITPSLARLKAGIGKYPPPPGDFAAEEMPYPY